VRLFHKTLTVPALTDSLDDSLNGSRGAISAEEGRKKSSGNVCEYRVRETGYSELSHYLLIWSNFGAIVHELI
jgi:hypothetical protein